MKKILLLLAGVSAAFSFLKPDGPLDPELRQAVSVVRHMAQPQHLSRSAFGAVLPHQQPNEWVSYLFSEMGAAEWPMRDDWADDTVVEQHQAIGAPLTPGAGRFVPWKRDRSAGKQLVVAGDDVTGEIELTAFLDPDEEPVWTARFELPEVIPEPLATRIAASNRDLGMRYRTKGR